jgi:hypothetical protein
VSKTKSASKKNAETAVKDVVKSTKPGASKKSAAATQAKAAKAVAANMGATQTLPEFMATAGELSFEERELIIDQALIMIEDLYVHLPLKRAMHAIDPIQRLKLLKQRHRKLSERAFHDEMISIYVHLRDLHTNYVLPNPFRTRTAFVPFRAEEYFEGDQRHYVVTQVSPTVTDPSFKPGAVITHWNNIPIDRAVEVNAEREAGSNLDARHARGLSAMTTRWMGMSLPPDEEKVTVRYLDGKTTKTIEFDWMVLLPGSPATGIDLLTEKGPVARLLGVDARTEVERRVLKLLFSPEAIASERQMAAQQLGIVPETESADVSVMPDVFSSFRPVDTPNGRFGYIRIRTFNVTNDEAFIQEFIRLAKSLPQNGLILDVRGNGGGLIVAGERLLQVLTPREIDPARLHFINTPLTLKLCEKNDFISQWAASIAQAIETGADFSQGFSLLPVEKYNDIGQRYQGPIVLVTDALCYSTTDIFAAGFQDHEIGKILGTSGNTGAGGANVWTHDLLQQFLSGADSPFKPLPNGASFRVAVRRTTRVGERTSVPVEDLGVVPDVVHAMTRDDVLNGNVDLINEAAKILSTITASSLTAESSGVSGDTLQVNATTKNLTRLDVLVDKRTRLTLDVADGTTTFSLSKALSGTRAVEIRGYNAEKLAAATRLSL